MLVYTTPHTVRVEIENNIHVLIVTGANDYKSFYLIHEEYGDPVFMFACKTESDSDSADIAIANAPDYIPEEWHL